MAFMPLALGVGAIVGFSLGLVGGGGSILAVPLLLYVVGIDDPHAAIGTSAFAVAVNALINLIGHWRAGNVKWPCAVAFATVGVMGALAGSTVGQAVAGQKLLFLFAVMMVGVGIAMLRREVREGDPAVRITPRIAVRLVAAGFAVGFLSGFFGIGGGFLIVPGLILGTGMPLLNAIGSSLLSVGLFGAATAANYAAAGMIDWSVAVQFVLGGGAAGWLGMRAAIVLASRRRMLTRLFASIIFAAAAYMLLRVTMGG